jgi:hypothetical protein
MLVKAFQINWFQQERKKISRGGLESLAIGLGVGNQLVGTVDMKCAHVDASCFVVDELPDCILDLTNRVKTVCGLAYTVQRVLVEQIIHQIKVFGVFEKA